MKELFSKIKNRVLLILKEFGNVLTNFLIPILGLVILVMEFLPIPATYIKFLKTVEYWLFYAYGTADKIEEGIKEKFN